MLNFATDAWTSPNHKAYVAVTVHFAKDGALISMLLDLVEVAQRHSGANLATAFAKILGDFGISDKVCACSGHPHTLVSSEYLNLCLDPQYHL